MKTFKKHIQNRLINDRFREFTSVERELHSIAFHIHERRKELNLSMDDLSRISNVPIQQIFNIENGFNTDLTEFLKICHALDLKLAFE